MNIYNNMEEVKLINEIPPNSIINADCLEAMKYIKNKSIDAIICDLPYQMVKCEWDSLIPFDKLWEQYKRIIKDNGAIVLTGTQPFTSALVSSNLKMFKYCWVWNKNRGSNYLQAKRQPLKYHEDICVFYKKQCTYNPQKTKGKPYKKTVRSNNREESTYHKDTRDIGYTYGSNERYPKSIISINTSIGKNTLHPTEKPVALMEYLIKTYTNENELILDNAAGSGTLGVAAKNTNRNYILIEKEKDYFDIINNRLK